MHRNKQGSCHIKSLYFILSKMERHGNFSQEVLSFEETVKEKAVKVLQSPTWILYSLITEAEVRDDGGLDWSDSGRILKNGYIQDRTDRACSWIRNWGSRKENNPGNFFFMSNWIHFIVY